MTSRYLLREFIYYLFVVCIFLGNFSITTTYALKAFTYYLTYLLTVTSGIHGREKSSQPSPFLSHPVRSIPKMLPVCMSRCTVLRVVPGFPHFLFPIGIHFHACGGILFSSILRVCPMYCQLLLLIVFVGSSSSTLSRTTLFEI